MTECKMCLPSEGGGAGEATVFTLLACATMSEGVATGQR